VEWYIDGSKEVVNEGVLLEEVHKVFAELEKDGKIQKGGSYSQKQLRAYYPGLTKPLRCFPGGYAAVMERLNRDVPEGSRGSIVNRSGETLTRDEVLAKLRQFVTEHQIEASL
jgi:hypothetical protein